MRTARKLVVKKDVLGELTTADLESVAGGDARTKLSNLMQCPTYGLPVCNQVSAMIQPCPTREVVC